MGGEIIVHDPYVKHWWEPETPDTIRLRTRARGSSSRSNHERQMDDLIANIHPGEILREEFLEPLGISQNRLAREIGVRRPAHKRDRSGEAGGHRRHGPATRPLFRNDRRLLDGSANGLRSRTRQRLLATRPRRYSSRSRSRAPSDKLSAPRAHPQPRSCRLDHPESPRS